jgi:hypothetical protein
VWRIGASSPSGNPRSSRNPAGISRLPNLRRVMVIETETCCAQNLDTPIGPGSKLRSFSKFASSSGFRTGWRFPSCDRLRGNRIVLFGTPVRGFPPFRNAPKGLSHETNAKHEWKLQCTPSKGFAEEATYPSAPRGGLDGNSGRSDARVPRKPAVRKSTRWMEPSHPSSSPFARHNQRAYQLLGYRRSAVHRLPFSKSTHRKSTFCAPEWRDPEWP